MKKIVYCVFSVVLALVALLSFSACNNDNGESTDVGKEYIIQYTDNTGTHQITVTVGMPYSLETLPKKEGYIFTGLFDAEVGGTQYVSANGSSLALFTDKQNLVLFPQFKAKEYTLFLDFQGADLIGIREYKVKYGERIPELPKNVNLAHSEFCGWYTKTNREGVQVADKYGLLSGASYVNDNNFDLSDEFIYLYAGFEAKKYTVTFCYEDGMDTEEMQVPYNTPINEVVPDRRVNGNAVLTWSKTPDGEAWNGKVTGDVVLYAKEYAPVIEFNSNGGSDATAIVARAGEAIKLPIPTKNNYKFVAWQTSGGTVFTATTMPAGSVKLTAKWQAMILFDTNGGTAVTNISELEGTSITLPETEKENYVFAGWYDEDGEKYTSTIMPKESVMLNAKYYAIKTIPKVLLSDNTEMESWYETPSMSKSLVLDLSELYDMGVSSVRVSVYYQSEVVTNLTGLTSMVWFSTNIASDAFKVWEYTDNKHTAIKSWTSQTYSTVLELDTEKYYICLCHNGWSSSGRWKNFMVEIEYLDLSTLY